jgi:hypothetical protein
MTVLDRSIRPQAGELPAFFAGYVSEVPAGDVLATLEREGESALRFLRGVPRDLLDHAYAPGKWTVREILAHVSDSERVFAYRALRFGRGDATPLAGFEQDDWVPESGAGRRPWEEMLDEFRVVRAATLHLFGSLAPDQWLRRGVANDLEISVRGLAWVMAGHELHHRRILVERYGLSAPPG